MGKKTLASRQPTIPATSSSSSSEDDDNNNNNKNNSSSSSDEEEEDTNQTQTQSINTTQPKPHVSPDSSDESDTDTDTDTPPPKPQPQPHKTPSPKNKAKPHVSKAVSDDDKDTDTDTDTPLAKVKASSKPKPKPTVAALPSKKEEEGLVVVGTPGKFLRVFSNEDEIVILEGMIEYKEKKGRDPKADWDDFTRFIVGRGLKVENVKREQVVNKVKKLKKKFQTAKKKKNIGGPHDVECFELSKRIWGNDVVVAVDGGEREESRGVKRGGSREKTKAVKDELEEEILRLGEGQWSEMAGDFKYMDEETSVEVLERVKRRRLKKLEGMLEDLDERRFVILKAIESYKASMME